MSFSRDSSGEWSELSAKFHARVKRELCARDERSSLRDSLVGLSSHKPCTCLHLPAQKT